MLFFENLPIYYINLDRAPDRMKFFVKQANDLNLKNVFRVNAIDGKDIVSNVPGLSSIQVAVTLSHIKAMFEFLKSDYKFAMICEDDIDFLNAKKINFNFYDIFKKNKSSLVCLQCSIVVREESHVPFKIVNRSKWFFSTSAYIISREYAELIIDKYTFEKNIDLNKFKRSIILDPRGGNMEISPVADQLVYEDIAMSVGLFTVNLFDPDVSTTDEHTRQFIKSRNDFMMHWQQYDRIFIEDIIND